MFCSFQLFNLQAKTKLNTMLKTECLSTVMDGLVWTGTYIKSMKYKSGVFTIRSCSIFVICVF